MRTHMHSKRGTRPGRVDVQKTAYEMQHRGAQRVLPGLLQWVEVAHGATAFDAARRLNRLGAHEQRLRERGLARGTVSNQCYGTNVLRGVLRHALLLVFGVK